MRTGTTTTGMITGGLKARAANLLKIIRATGAILLAVKIITGFREIMTVLTEEMEGRTINSESLRPLKDLYRRVRLRIRRNTGMRKSAESARKGISALRKI